MSDIYLMWGLQFLTEVALGTVALWFILRLVRTLTDIYRTLDRCEVALVEGVRVVRQTYLLQKKTVLYLEKHQQLKRLTE